MDHQSNKGNSIATNRTIGTNAQVECTATQPEAIKDILSRYNDTYFTSGTPID